MSRDRSLLLLRLACVKPAASVRSEPGSNSHVKAPQTGIKPIQSQTRIPVVSKSAAKISSPSPHGNRPKTSSRLACIFKPQRCTDRHKRPSKDHTRPQGHTSLRAQNSVSTPPAHPFHLSTMSNNKKSAGNRATLRDDAFRRRRGPGLYAPLRRVSNPL